MMNGMSIMTMFVAAGRSGVPERTIGSVAANARLAAIEFDMY
jgi:hypothetical protein